MKNNEEETDPSILRLNALRVSQSEAIEKRNQLIGNLELANYLAENLKTSTLYSYEQIVELCQDFCQSQRLLLISEDIVTGNKVPL